MDSQAKEKPSNESILQQRKQQAKKDFMNMSSAQQAKILRQHNPEALAKIDREIAEKEIHFKKISRVFTFVLVAVIFYILILK